MDFALGGALPAGMTATPHSPDGFENCYRFAAIRGTQGGSAFYIAAVPFRTAARLLALGAATSFERKINKPRVQRITSYITTPDRGHVIAPVHVSVGGDMRFEPLGANRSAGNLEIDLGAQFEIIDGRHRIAAISLAMRQRGTLGWESLPISFHTALDAEASSRMFKTLNQAPSKPQQQVNRTKKAQNAVATDGFILPGDEGLVGDDGGLRIR